jgi:small subunit ribosomal protein S16
LEEYTVVRIRLLRRGKNKKPAYRIVVADSRSPRDGKFIEIIGNYNPVVQPKTLNVKADRARYWLSVGAQPSDTVKYLFSKVGIDAVPGTPYTPETETGTPATADAQS